MHIWNVLNELTENTGSKNNNNNDRFTTLCPELPGWAGTRRYTHLPTILIIIQSLSASRSIASSLFKLRAWQSFCTTSFWRQIITKNSPSGHHRTTFSGYIFATGARINNRKKNLLNSNISPTCPHSMVNFAPLAAKIGSLVLGTPTTFSGFRVLAALLHNTRSWRWTIGATYIQKGGHHVGHWPTF